MSAPHSAGEIQVANWTWKMSPKAVLAMRKAGGVPFDFLRITMSEVIVTGVEMSAGYEQVRLSFAKVKQEYMVQNAQGGSGGIVTGTFDIKANVPA
jgi:type VI secretion system secreted protein Hcp